VLPDLASERSPPVAPRPGGGADDTGGANTSTSGGAGGATEWSGIDGLSSRTERKANPSRIGPPQSALESTAVPAND
jgi:hypothetical protein